MRKNYTEDVRSANFKMKTYEENEREIRNWKVRDNAKRKWWQRKFMWMSLKTLLLLGLVGGIVISRKEMNTTLLFVYLIVGLVLYFRVREIQGQYENKIYKKVKGS